MFKILNGQTPDYLSNKFIFRNDNSSYRASGRSREKSQISRDFQGQIRGKTADSAGISRKIFEASSKNGRFRESFPSKFRWKAIGFVLI